MKALYIFGLVLFSLVTGEIASRVFGDQPWHFMLAFGAFMGVVWLWVWFVILRLPRIW